MTKARADVILVKFRILAQDFAREEGLDYSSLSGRYGDHDMKLSLTFGEPGENGETTDELKFNQYCRLFGLTKEDRGKRFTSRGIEYELVGIKPNNHKYPLIGRNVNNGKKYKFKSPLIQELRQS